MAQEVRGQVQQGPRLHHAHQRVICLDSGLNSVETQQPEQLRTHRLVLHRRLRKHLHPVQLLLEVLKLRDQRLILLMELGQLAYLYIAMG